MFKFEREQIVYDVAGVKVGGNIGENPTVMIGSIFYKGDKNIKEEKIGTFDLERAKRLIERVEELSERTGLGAMVDVVCSNALVADRYLEFVADATRMPILIDAVSQEAALRGLECAKELGITERTIFNSITPDTKEPVFQKIREVGLESAVILTYSTKAIMSSKERVRLLEALLPKVKAVGVRKVLVDTVVMDVATLGLACKAIHEVKDRFGYPAGCGAHNAVASWKALKQRKDKLLTLACSSIVNGLPIAVGADFVLYGPINEAEYMFPAVAIVNAAYGQVLMEEGERLDTGHPRFKIGRL